MLNDSARVQLPALRGVTFKDIRYKFGTNLPHTVLL